MGSMETSGNTILTDYCDEFPKPSPTRSNHVLPPYFLSKYPEACDPVTHKILPNPRRVFTKKDNDRLHGIETGQTGEMAEHEVYKMIYDWSCKTQAHNFLSIHTYELDTKGKRCKEQALRNELPTFPVGIAMNIELDVVVFVQNVGMIALEVKSTGSSSSIVTAERQLSGGEAFFTALMSTVTSHSSTATLPYVRVIFVPNDNTPSPSAKTAHGSYHLHSDIISQPHEFQRMWDIFVKELVALKVTSTFSDADFSRFTKIAVGLWACKQTPAGLVFDRYKASVVTGVQEADHKVDKGVLSSNTKTKSMPLTDVVFNEPHETPRQCQELELVYFTIEQEALYNHCPQTLVRGAAGSGKSLHIIMKVIDLFRKRNPNQSLLVASDPFIYKCEKIFQANGLSTEIIQKFPLQPTAPTSTTMASSSSATATPAAPIHPTANVVIMKLRDFLGVPSTTLKQYDISSYNVLVDDLQSYFISSHDKFSAKYSNIATYIDQLYLNRIHTQLHLWVCFDILQSVLCDFDDRHIPSLLFINPTTPRTLNITTHTLTKILRNAFDIIPLITHARNERIAKTPDLTAQNTVGNVIGGHNITCSPVDYHKLSRRTSDRHKGSFYLKMVEIQLQHLVGIIPSFLPSHIAILCDDKYKVRAKAIGHLVNSKFNCNIQTIEDMVRNNNLDDVVCDDVENTASFEFQYVIHIRWKSYGMSCDMYNLFSRARSKLVIIDCDVSKPPMTTSDIHVTTWARRSNGEFVNSNSATGCNIL